MYSVHVLLKDKGEFETMAEVVKVFFPEIKAQVESGISANVFNNTNSVVLKTEVSGLPMAWTLGPIDLHNLCFDFGFFANGEILENSPQVDEELFKTKFIEIATAKNPDAKAEAAILGMLMVPDIEFRKEVLNAIGPLL